MRNDTSDGTGPGWSAPELLVRELLPDHHGGIIDRLQELGWTAAHLGAWADGEPAVVLYDPIDGRVVGAGLAGGSGSGSFRLLAAMVASDLVDHADLCERVVRALGDRVRRLGGEHLAIPLQGTGLSDAQLAAMGLVVGPGSAGGTTVPAGADGLGYLEL